MTTHSTITVKWLTRITVTILTCANISSGEDLWPAKGAGASRCFQVFQQRLDVNTHGLHEGIDIPADDQDPNDPNNPPAVNEVQLPAAMRLHKVYDNNLIFRTGTSPDFMYHYYWHLTNIPFAPVDEGTSHAAGTTIGYIQNAYSFPVPDHLHLTVSPKDLSGGDSVGAVCAYAKNPLAYYSFSIPNAAPEFIDRDNPVVAPKTSWDDDDDVFQFMCGGSYLAGTAKTTDGKWIVSGNTDCVAEVQDRMGWTGIESYPTFYPAVYKTGYCIYEDKTNGGHDVRSGESPYVLFEADKAAVVINAGTPETYTSKAGALYETTQKDIDFPSGKKRNFHYVLTNTKGTDGSVINLDADQYWKTKASGAGTNGGNGVGADNATKAQDAYFRDGEYTVQAQAWDLVGTTATFHTLYVENFPPAVAQKTPVGGACGGGTAAVTDNVVITFSEPMNKTATEAAVSIKKKSDGSPVAFSASWNSGEYILTCDPTSDLAYDTEYEVTVNTAAKDPYGGASFNGAPLDSEFDSANHNGTGGEGGDAVTWTFWTVSP